MLVPPRHGWTLILTSSWSIKTQKRLTPISSHLDLFLVSDAYAQYFTLKGHLGVNVLISLYFLLF